jgi:hypothetical protein
MFIKKLKKKRICLYINYCFLNIITKKDCYLILLMRSGKGPVVQAIQKV